MGIFIGEKYDFKLVPRTLLKFTKKSFKPANHNHLIEDASNLFFIQAILGMTRIILGACPRFTFFVRIGSDTPTFWHVGSDKPALTLRHLTRAIVALTFWCCSNSCQLGRLCLHWMRAFLGMHFGWNMAPQIKWNVTPLVDLRLKWNTTLWLAYIFKEIQHLMYLHFLMKCDLLVACILSEILPLGWHASSDETQLLVDQRLLMKHILLVGLHLEWNPARWLAYIF